VIDNALKPAVDRRQAISAQGGARILDWVEAYCVEGTALVGVGQPDIYYLSADGFLMPSRKGQPAPDLRISMRSEASHCRDGLGWLGPAMAPSSRSTRNLTIARSWWVTRGLSAFFHSAANPGPR